MTAYSVFPRQEQPMDQSAGSRAHSRFVEGSMNDRTSNAPPVDFLGPEEIAAYERQFFLENSSTNGSKMRPISTNGSVALSTSSKRSSFFSVVRERFSMSRTKSSSSIKTKSSMSVREEQQEQPRHNSVVETSSTPPTMPGYYPSREEVMQNYKSLVEAGFFSSHAIQGTRHNPPPSAAATDNAATSQQRMEAPLPLSPAPNTQGLPFSQPVRVLTKRPETARAFTSIPYSATQPSPTGDPPKTTYPMPDPRPPLPGLSRPSQKENDYKLMPPPPPPGPSSPQRGTKRGMADMAGGATEREMTNGNGSAEGNARRLVKKLRKSASRVSADLTRPLTSAGITSSSSSSGYARNSIFGGSSVSLASDAGSAAGGGGSRAMGLVRSLSSTFKRDGASGKMTTPNPDVVLPDAGSIPATPTTPTNRLSKARKALGRRASLSRPSSSRASFPSHPPVSFNPNRLPTTVQPPVLPRLDLGTSASLPPSPTKPDIDAMVIDLPSSPPPRQSVEVPMSGLGVPSFHYPQRQRPLAVVPDLNRGVPDLQPLQFAGRYGKTDGFCFGIPAAAAVAGEKENGDVF